MKMLNFIRDIFRSHDEHSPREIYLNGIVSIGANLLQNVLFALFFVILARHFGPVRFADYVLANSTYQLVVVLAPFGLLSYFIREYAQFPDQRSLSVRLMLATEFLLAVLGYAVIVCIPILMGYESQVRTLSAILGMNILFDNILYSTRAIYIAEGRQVVSAIGTLTEAVLKLLLGLTVIIWELSLVQITLVAVVLRFITLQINLSNLRDDRRADLRALVHVGDGWEGISFVRMFDLLKRARTFAVIATVYVLFWRINVFALSKLSTRLDVSFYDVGTRIFAMAQVAPSLFMQSYFPTLAKTYREDSEQFIVHARRALKHVGLFGLAVAPALSAISPQLVPLLFGTQYHQAGMVGSIVSWSLIPFSFANVQANILLASGNERADMWLNIGALAVNGSCALLLAPSMGSKGSAVAILISVCVFFITQQLVLSARKIRLWTRTTLLLLACGAVNAVVCLAAGRNYPVFAAVLGQLLFWPLVFRLGVLDLSAVTAGAKRMFGKFL